MKKILFSTVLLILISSSIRAQRNYASSVGASIGYTQDGYGFQASYNYHLGRYRYVQGAIFTSFSKQTYETNSNSVDIPYMIMSFNLGYFDTVFRTNNKKFSIYLGGGITGGYESINNGDKELFNGAIIDSESQLIYGGFVASELDFELNNSTSFILRIQEYYHVNSDLGNLIPYVGGGLRYQLF